MSHSKTPLENTLIGVGNVLYAVRSCMSLFYIGLALVMLTLLFVFVKETVKFVFGTITASATNKTALIIKVLELVDMAMVAQLVWVVCLAGFSLFVTSQHFDDSAAGGTSTKERPDWLDHVNTYNLKLKLAFAIISISGVHALKTYLEGSNTLSMLVVASIHAIFVISAIGIAYAEQITKKE